MNHDTHETTNAPVDQPADPLTELLRRGARDLLKQAVEAELQAFLEAHRDLQLADGRPGVVRNGYLPARTVQTGIGDVALQVPRRATGRAPDSGSPRTCCRRICAAAGRSRSCCPGCTSRACRRATSRRR